MELKQINELRKLAGLSLLEAKGPTVDEQIKEIGDKFKVDFTDADGKQVKKALKYALKLNSKPVNESYAEGSLGYDNDVDKISEALQTALLIVNSKNWKQHMDDTDKNYSNAKAKEASVKLLDFIKAAIKANDDMYEHMIKISEE